MTTTDLAKMMNVSEADLTGFLDCLRVWLAKGYSFEAAVERHMEVMRGMVARSVEIGANEGVRASAAEMVFAAVNA